jgi:hypothetical protein
VANIAFYGPRAMPKPIFPVDPATGFPPQSKNLFVSTTDTNVRTDATGFKYQLQLPSGLTTGTYGVRVRIGDFSRVNDTSYVVESIAFRTVQVGILTGAASIMKEVLGDGIGDNDGICETGEACFEVKVAGDTCVECHGNGTAPFHDARHVVVWDTDECNACHDYSGNHAASLSNRVHAVHASNTYGDMSNPLGFTQANIERDWSALFRGLIREHPVRWPGDRITIGVAMRPTRCTACHTDNGTFPTTARVPGYRKNVREVACLGCHGDPITGGTTTPGPAINHMFLNGGDYPKP